MWNRLAIQANKIRWQSVLFLLIGLIQFVYAVLMWMSNPHTIPDLLYQDTGIPGTVLAVLFLWSGFRFFRSRQPRWSLLLTLLPQAIYCALGVYYVAVGRFDMTGLVAHGGVLVLSALCLTAPLYPRIKIMLSPLISLGLLLYAIGMAGQPDAGAAGYLTDFNPLATVALAFSFAMAAGYVFDNHLKPHALFVAFLPQMAYSLAAMGDYISSSLTLSLYGGLSHWLLSVLLLVFLFTETERADGLV